MYRQIRYTPCSKHSRPHVTAHPLPTNNNHNCNDIHNDNNNYDDNNNDSNSNYGIVAIMIITTYTNNYIAVTYHNIY